MYNEEDYMMLSGVQHFEFCRRQWALIHVEQQWFENIHTIKGMFLHEKAHEAKTEIRNGVIITRGMNVFSRTLGIRGICDVVEFRPDPNGVTLQGRMGKYVPVPIEYKKGKPKSHNADVLQLCAQAACLEEMLVCDVPEGFLFYGETRRRLHVVFNHELRIRLTEMLEEMHEYYKRGYTPKSKVSKSCKACSLNDVCLPKLAKSGSVSAYLSDKLNEKEVQ
jgi:CRISPR-associated exonuclease Cas4